MVLGLFAGCFGMVLSKSAWGSGLEANILEDVGDCFAMLNIKEKFGDCDDVFQIKTPP